MKTLKDFYEDTYGDMAHGPRHREISFDILGWWIKRQTAKLKGVMDRSRTYWAKKRQKQRVLKMLRLQRKFERAMRRVKENVNV